MRQYQGGGVEIIGDYVKNLINLATGGFVFMAAATLKYVIFVCFNPEMGLTVYHTGRASCLSLRTSTRSSPAGGASSWCSLSVKSRTGSCNTCKRSGRPQKVLPVRRAAVSASFSCPSMTVSPPLCSPALIPLTKTLSTESITHVKELAIFYPGNLIVKVALTANLSAPAFGLAAMDCLDFADRCAAPQSCENADFLLVDCSDPDSVGPSYLESLSEHYLLLGSRGRLIVGVPALESIYRTCFPFLRALTF